MRMATVTTTRITAVHTVFSDNVTLTDHLDIPPLFAIRWPDSIVMVIAISRTPDAVVRTTTTVRASGIVMPQKRLALVKILADITTSAFIDVSTI